MRPNPAESEWKRIIEDDGGVCFERVACILPAYQSGTPEWYRRIAQVESNKGNKARAEMFRREADKIELGKVKRVLGEHIFLTTAVAYLLAALLRSGRKMPAGAQRWMAQQALKSWLPHLPRPDRREVIAMLGKCSMRVLGKELAAVVADAKNRLGSV